ncbi:hypothetical protein, partial [Burkholderia gladioli]|uniref:hypothetical protein n=1 Tax=Burkholderia gladioli TaxID=28095 RepID=UPI001ABA8D0B
LFQNPDDLAFRESGRLHAKFPVDPAARKFYLEHPLILGGTTVAIVALNDRDTFTIKCGTSDINMPCGVEKVNAKNSSLTQKNIVITVMRKKDFFSKDRVVFVV